MTPPGLGTIRENPPSENTLRRAQTIPRYSSESTNLKQLEAEYDHFVRRIDNLKQKLERLIFNQNKHKDTTPQYVKKQTQEIAAKKVILEILEGEKQAAFNKMVALRNDHFPRSKLPEELWASTPDEMPPAPS